MKENTKKAEMQVEDKEFTEQETKNQMRMLEEDLLRGLLEAADYKEDENEMVPMEITRNDKLLFRFHIRPLGEEDYDMCKKKHTKYVRNKQLGIKLPEDTNSVRYRCELIYRATVEEDRKALWDNKQAWNAFNSKSKPVVCGLDVIEHALKAGEKDRIVAEIDKISAYDSNLEEVAKN